ncbi:hypothetical protein [Aliikangiella maris]|uniref:Uncharacterized protein n=2 Tax=Aliikangiella maris TaxID=3162458 RepID=A0ABV2BUV4_9GAMM
MKLKTFISSTLITATLVSSSLMAAQVTRQYLDQTYNELRNWAGRYATPTLYVDQPVCTQDMTAYACGQNIQLGTRFLQSIENQYPLAAKGIFAHEWGHSIQFRYNIYSQPPYQELQADCVSGSFAYVGENNLGYQGLFRSTQMSAYNAGDPTHGSGSQRANYVRSGYNTNGNLVGCFN